MRTETTPKQTMREFFERSDIRAGQEVQKHNPPDSPQHIGATLFIQREAEKIGAGWYFADPDKVA